MNHNVILSTLATVLAMLSPASAATVTLFAGGGPRAAGTAVECRLADPFAVELPFRVRTSAVSSVCLFAPGALCA